MKKFFIILGVIVVIIISILSIELVQLRMKSKEYDKFNSEFENYNKDELYGIDVATVINKAVDNNERYNIEKKVVGNHEEYVEDEENSIKVSVKMIINNTTYPMEQIYNLGMQSFIEYFGQIKFKCTNIEYHKSNGKISKMEFEATEY